MNEPSRPSVAALLADHDLVSKALARGAREAALSHARAGNPVATWRDGKVVWLSPEEVFRLVAEETAREAGDRESS